MKRWYREWILLKRGERYALLVVGWLFFISTGIRIAAEFVPGTPWEPEGDVLCEARSLLEQMEREAQLAQMKEGMKEGEDGRNRLDERQPRVVVNEPFDPNAASSESLKAMNLPGRVVDNWLKYLDAGGRFGSPEDVRRIYGMDDRMFEALRDQIEISEESVMGDASNEHPRRESVRLQIELNRADTVLLKKIRGIGTVYANRIIRYRELLGGFTRREQLLEVYGIDSSLYRSLRKYVIIDTLAVRKIDVNDASFGDLLAHPYLDRSSVASILHFRAFSGTITSMKELYDNSLLDSSLIQKIEPYFSFVKTEDLQ